MREENCTCFLPHLKIKIEAFVLFSFSFLVDTVNSLITVLIY